MKSRENTPHQSRLIPKNHFVSMFFFREYPLINWTFTDIVLFTAYDVYRTNNYWVDDVINTGSTLKEGMVSLGFPKSTKFMVDTGVFEIEAKKAGIARNLGIEVEIELSNEQIFEVYQISGGDLFVAPDEIILPTDSRDIISEKVSKIKQNILDLLEIIHPSKVVAVLQGSEKRVIDSLFDFYKGQGISMFAQGGLIPLWKHDKNLLSRVVRYARELTEGYWLHAFGLPHLKLIQFYLHDVGLDSIDTSVLLYLTARRRYVVKSELLPVRLVNFSLCNCDGCSNLTSEMNPRSLDFFVSLYIHNILEASKLAEKHHQEIDSNGKSPKEPRIRDSDEFSQPDYHTTDWSTANESMRERYD